MKANIVRPDYYAGNKVVKMTATVTSGDVTEKREFSFLVRRADRTDQQSVTEDVKYVNLNVPTIIRENVKVMASSELPCGSTVVWKSSAVQFLEVNGTVHRPDFGLPSEDVTITATITKGEVTQEVVVQASVLSMTEEDELDIVAKKVTWELIKGTNIDKARITENLVFPEAIDEIPVVWNSSEPRFVAADGVVTRPEYTESDAQITVTATLKKGDKSKTVSVSGLKILKKSPSAQQRCDEYANSTDNLLKWVSADGTNGNVDLSSVIEGFVLPAENEDMLLTWAVVNSTGEPVQTSYFKIDYVDDSQSGKLVTARTSRRYVATVVRPSSNDVQTYIKVTATISETTVDGTVIPGGTANKVHPVIILQETPQVMSLMAMPMRAAIHDGKFENILDKTEYGRATWSVAKHLEYKNNLYSKETLQEDITVE